MTNWSSLITEILPNVVRHTRPIFATVCVVAIAATTLLAQFGSFDPAFDGELWSVRHELVPSGDDLSAGVAFVDGTLYVVERGAGSIVVYDGAGQIVAKPGAQWNTADADSPVSDMVLNQLLAATVNVDGTDRDAILVSDGASNRAAAFDTNGAYLFTLRLTRPTDAPLYQLAIGELAMAPDAKFSLTIATQTLTLSGKFAASWFEQINLGAVDSGAMVFQGPMSFPVAGSEFQATPTAIKRGNEHDGVAPAPQRVQAIEFDTAGNLLMLDAFTERLNVYDPALRHLFTFGTPVADGTVAEFNEPWGMAFWPDAGGGRIFINDTYKSRILVYRLVDTPGSPSGIDTLRRESVIKGFLPSSPAIYLNAIAVDPSSGSLAVTDFAEDDVFAPRTVVLRQPRLAAFNYQVIDASGAGVDSVCTASDYRIRFSLTVPAGRAPVDGVDPQLLLDGLPTSAPALPSQTYPSATLLPAQVVTYTYSLTAPIEAGDVAVIAGATASNTSDILRRAETISVSDCAAETDPSTITASPSAPPQVSGWTPVFNGGGEFTITLTAQDNDGIETIEYRMEGANESGDDAIAIGFDGAQTGAAGTVPFAEVGRTTLSYRVRDGHGIWSGWQTLNIRTRLVVDRRTNENSPEEFRVGDPEGSGFTFSVNRVPDGVTFSSQTGQFAGTPSFAAVQPYSSDPEVASGVYTIVVTETGPLGQKSNVSFTWSITHINRPPSIRPVFKRLTAIMGEEFSLQVEGLDPDSDPSFWTVNGRGAHSGQELPPSITIDPTTGIIHGQFSQASDSAYTLSVGLSECATVGQAPPCKGMLLPGAHLATLYELSVGVTDRNDRADVVNPGPQVSAENDLVSLQIVAADPENDTLEYVAGGLPAGLTIDSSTGLISGRVGWNAAGTYAVTVEVFDNVNETPRAVTFGWKITNTNRPPVLANPGNQASTEGVTITALPVSAKDPDGDTLTYTATGLPGNLTINSSTGVISGTLNYTSAATSIVIVKATDPSGLFASAAFIWKVANILITPTANADTASVNQGQSVIINVRGNDVTAGGLTLSVTGVTTPSSGSAVISAGGMTVIYTATSSTAVGATTFFYTVSNGEATATAKVTVNVQRSNQSPLCTAAAASPGLLWPPNHKPVSVTLSGITDPDGGTPVVKFTSVLQDEPTNTQGDGNTTQDAGIEDKGANVWVRAERMGGENKNVYGRVYIMGFTATDSDGASCAGTVAVGVPHDQGNHNVPIPSSGRWNSVTGALVTPPAPNAKDDSITTRKNTAAIVAVQANDVVYGAVALSISSAPASGTTTVNANGTVTYSPAANWTGSTSFTYRLNGGAGSDTAVVTVTIKK